MDIITVENSVDANRRSSEKPEKRSRVIHFLENNILFVVLVVLIILGAIISDNFLTLYNIQNIFINVAVLGMLAIGQTLVMLVKEIDLSQGSLMAFSPIMAINLTDLILSMSGNGAVQGGNYVTAGLVMILFFTILIGALTGLLSGFISVRGHISTLIVSLGMLYALRGIAYIVSGGHPFYLTRLHGFEWLGTYQVFNIPVSFLIYLLFGITMIVLLRYTKLGPRIYSTGGNEKASIYSGIRTGHWKMLAFVISGLCAAIGALFYCSRLESVEAAQAVGYELQAIAIVVIGGTTLEGGRGKVLGTIIAGMILGIVVNIITLIGLVVWYQTIIIGIIIISATFAYEYKSIARK